MDLPQWAFASAWGARENCLLTTIRRKFWRHNTVLYSSISRRRARVRDVVPFETLVQGAAGLLIQELCNFFYQLSARAAPSQDGFLEWLVQKAGEEE
jgi:hypothetical protein